MSACRSTDSSGSDRLEGELVKVKAQLDRSNGVIATKVGVVLDAIIAKVIDAAALGKEKKIYKRYSEKDTRILVETYQKLEVEWPYESAANLLTKLRAHTGVEGLSTNKGNTSMV